MPFELRYHPDVKEIDIPALNIKLKKRLKNAIETRLMSAPHQYGEPLRKTLKGYWKLRVGDYSGVNHMVHTRVVFKIVKNEIRVLGIIHRKDVYAKIDKRV